MKITVIMGAYNCESTLTEAINSLLQQTFNDFDIVICDDGSTDQTYKILEEFKVNYPDKFIVLKNDRNMGLNYTLNRALKEATGEYIARMDADDLSLEERFEVQSSFLDNHSDYDFVSSNMIHFDEEGDWGISQTKEKPVAKDFVYNSPFPHAPVMIRKKAYLDVGGYTVDSKLLRVEDYHLWVKLYENNYKGFNIKKPLYKMRDDKNAYARRTLKNRINGVYVRILAINKLGLSKWNYIYTLRPIIVGLLPSKVYDYLHKKRLNK